MQRCKAHPVKKRPMLKNEVTSYAAAMNVLLAYYHLDDDWKDDRKITSLAARNAIRRKVRKVVRQYPRQSRAIRESLKELAACERENSMDLDRTAGCFGKLMEELFLYRKDVWEEQLRRMGFFLGKFIYLMDAYEDLPEDLEKIRYNPLKNIYAEEGYEERIREILCMMIAESTAEFERLPCLIDVDILRNILYDGIWSRYNKIQMKKSEEQKNE